MLIALVQTDEKVKKAYLNTSCSSDPFCGLSVYHVIHLDSYLSLEDQSIIKSTKYYKYQKSIIDMKRVLYVLRKICLLIEAIINITNKKKYWRKYYKYCRKYYKYDRNHYKNIQSFMNMRESIVKIFKVL